MYILFILFYFRLREHVITVNDISVGLPYHRKGLLMRDVTNVWMRLTHETGVEVLWDGAQRIEIVLPSKFRNKVCA